MPRPTDDEIEDQISDALEAQNQGSRWPGMSYEQGVEAALRWALGEEEIPPMNDEDEED